MGIEMEQIPISRSPQDIPFGPTDDPFANEMVFFAGMDVSLRILPSIAGQSD